MDNFTERLSELFSAGLAKSEIVGILSKEFEDINYECLRSRVRRYVKRNKQSVAVQDIERSSASTSPITHGVEYKADGTAIFDRIIYLQETTDLTPENILKAHGLDPVMWKIISCKNNYYQQQKAGGEILNLYQSKITVKPSETPISFDDMKKHFNALQAVYSGNNNRIQFTNMIPDCDRNIMYEVNIADLHLGKICWSDETGETFNSEIAKQRFDYVIDYECKRIMDFGGKVEKIVFVWTNDFFNSDGISKATTGGTPQDTDLQWQNLFQLGCELLVSAIDKLSQLADVETFYIASNHSRQVDFYALNYLSAWFRTYDNVKINVNSSPRYYIKYGVNLIGFAHSYYEKKQNLPYLMSIERPEDWATTTYREYHLAHYHSEKTEEIGGIIFRWLPSITGSDSWHTECGYVGSVKRSYSFVYDKNRGLIQINSTVVQ